MQSLANARSGLIGMEPMAYSIQKRILFSAIIFLGSVVFVLGAILALDQAIKFHYTGLDLWNFRGYRGEALGKKQPGEIRIAAFGGSTTFGVLVDTKEAYPAQLEQILKERGHSVKVANLGVPSQGILGMSYDADLYDRLLNYDIAILYEGYNDSDPKMPSQYTRGTDGIFHLFHYKLTLPAFLHEKGAALMYGVANLASYYKGTLKKEDFKSNTIRFQVGKGFQAADEFLAKVSDKLSQFDDSAKKMEAMGMQPYAGYLKIMSQTIQTLLDRNKIVIVACPPPVYSNVNQQLVRKLIKEKFQDKVHYFDLKGLYSSTDKSLVLDFIHLNPRGNRILAKAFADRLEPLLIKPKLISQLK